MAIDSRRPNSRFVAGVYGKKPLSFARSIAAQSQYERRSPASWDAASDFLDRVRIDAVAPVAGDELDLQAEPPRHLLPKRGEVAGLEHEDAVAGGKRVRERRLPRPRSRGRVHDHRLPGAEDALQSRQHFL